jgi:hypothetical protein
VEVKEMQRLREELKKRAESEHRATLESFAARGLAENQLKILAKLFRLLDPILTPEPEPETARGLLFQFIGLLPEVHETFQRKVDIESTPEIDFIETILSRSRQGKKPDSGNSS